MVASRFPILEAEFTPFTHKKEQLLKLWIPDIVLICLVRYLHCMVLYGTVWYCLVLHVIMLKKCSFRNGTVHKLCYLMGTEPRFHNR
jgi:hypothetical protein